MQNSDNVTALIATINSSEATPEEKKMMLAFVEQRHNNLGQEANLA